MEKGRNLVPSGVEPVDKLSGGLESGKLYLVHGEGPSKSLFGYQFLIEGLKRGEHVALIINYSPEDAVRWFARLGYDCLEDIYSGRLVVLECAEENLDQIARMKQLSPVLRELRWLIGDKNPERVVFEPIGRLVTGEQGSTETRSREFAAWAREIGSTSVLIASGRSEDLITDLLPLVTESFRFELRQEAGSTIRYLFFEKSPDMPGQAIEADPSKGIFLVDRPLDARAPAHSRGNESSFAPRGEADRTLFEAGWEAPSLPRPDRDARNQRDPFSELIREILADVEALKEPVPRQEQPSIRANLSRADPKADLNNTSGFEETEPAPATIEIQAQISPVSFGQASVEHAEDSPASLTQSDEEEAEISDLVESLLKRPTIERAVGENPPAVELESIASSVHDAAEQVLSFTTSAQVRVVRPEDYNVLLIAADPQCAERALKSLVEYHVEQAVDGVSGLAKLISFRPDLVVLDTDMGAVDGFEMLKHIRANLDVPIVALSSSRLRASDRIRSAELGADYYLTKPFSQRELRQKARQLIARYRHIDEWITGIAQGEEPLHGPHGSAPDGRGNGIAAGNPRAVAGAQDARPAISSAASSSFTAASPPTGSRRKAGDAAEPDRASMLTYPEFVRRIEELVEVTIDGDSWFSVIGCRVNHNSDGRANARTAALAQMVPDLIRNCDVASVNQAGDLMILLTDADENGARAFTARLHETLHGRFKTDPVIWVRTFPFSSRRDN
jgi:CheY-like chemotaxis protein/KaiC/GvpD/RAD55 family RecA-like ATPase